MQKLVCIIVEARQNKGVIEKRYRLFESCMRKFSHASDPETRPWVIDDSDSLEIITDSILLYREGPVIKFGLPEELDPKIFFPLYGVDLIIAREKLGLPPN
ncbi:MAG: hypothetical protein KAI71_00470 [Candidatus Pacebacteria bacterium]|nr:hypothetical protein [Candidatus Paceibacterota bacterium]